MRIFTVLNSNSNAGLEVKKVFAFQMRRFTMRLHYLKRFIWITVKVSGCSGTVLIKAKTANGCHNVVN